jgi:hypothetical protein
MPLSNGRVRKALLCTVVALLPALLFAENKSGSVEVGGLLTFIRFDSQTELSSRFAPSLVVGYNFTKRHGAEFLLTSTTATPRTGPSIATDIDMLRVGYTFNAYPREKMVSFFRLGLGIWKIDPEENPEASDRLSESDSDLMIYSGGGVRFFIKPRLAIRLAGTVDFIDVGDGFSNPDVQATGELGVSFLLGGHEDVPKPDEAAPAETKPEEKKPEEKKPEDSGTAKPPAGM